MPIRGRSSCLVPLSPREHAVWDVIAVPGAGAGPHCFQAWRRVVPPNWFLNAVCLPGRGPRFCEPFATDMGLLTHDLAAEIGRERAGRQEVPLVLFGHSMGALVALDLAARLKPHLLVVAGCAPPQSRRRQPYGANAEADMTEAVRDLVQALGLADKELFDELVELSTPILAADLALLDRFRPTGTVLACDILAMYGEKDPILGEAWTESTTGRAEVALFPGGHFFIQHAAAEVVARLHRRLAAALH